MLICVLSPSLYTINPWEPEPSLFHLSQNLQHLVQCLSHRKCSLINKQILISVMCFIYKRQKNPTPTGLSQKGNSLAYITEKLRGDVGFGYFWTRDSDNITKNPFCPCPSALLSVVLFSCINSKRLPPCSSRLSLYGRRAKVLAASDNTFSHFMVQVVQGSKRGFLLDCVCFPEASAYRWLTLIGFDFIKRTSITQSMWLGGWDMIIGLNQSGFICGNWCKANPTQITRLIMGEGWILQSKFRGRVLGSQKSRCLLCG